MASEQFSGRPATDRGRRRLVGYERRLELALVHALKRWYRRRIAVRQIRIMDRSHDAQTRRERAKALETEAYVLVLRLKGDTGLTRLRF